MQSIYTLHTTIIRIARGEERGGGRNSSVGSVLGLQSCVMQRHEFNPQEILKFMSPKTLSEGSINRGLVCVHMHSSFHHTDSKGPEIHVLEG